MLNYKVVDDFVEIYIESPKHGKKTVYVDVADLGLVSDKNWWVIKSGKTFYCCCYNHETGDRKYEMHQLLMGVRGADHKDNNGLNNRRSNLRLATKEQNAQNKQITSRNKSGYKGIFYDKWDRNSSYRAAVKVNGKTISGQRYKNPLLAAYQYNEFAAHYYGQFANLNKFTDEQITLIKKDPKFKYCQQKTKEKICQ
jgi:hypothetical protein